MLVIVPVRIFCPLDLDELLRPWLRLQKVGSHCRWIGISGRLRPKLPIIQSRIGRFGVNWRQGPPCYVTASCSWPVITLWLSKYTISARPRGVGEETWCHPLPHKLKHTKTWTFLWASGINHLTCPTTWSCMSWALSRCCLRCWFFSHQPTCIVNHCQVHKRLSNDTQPLISGGAQLYATPQTC